MTEDPPAEGRAGERPGPAAVLGAGTMGRGIAQLLLQAGLEVTLIDPVETTLDDAVKSLERLFTLLHAKGKLEQLPAELMKRLSTAGAVEAAAEARWLFEAAPEDLELKRRLFARAAAAAPHAVLATNTSTLSVTAIAAATARPEDVVGMHFFNPPGVMRLVEIVPGMLTRKEVVQAVTELARRLGREPVIAKDSPGFIVNRLARPYYLEALRLHADGIPLTQVDAIMRSAGFRQGPFELLDLIGIDVNLASSESVYRAYFEEPRYRPHPLQRAMVSAGLLGRKTGRGFYRYDEQGQPLAQGGGALDDVGDAPAPADSHPARLAVIGTNSAARTLRELLSSAVVSASDEGVPSPQADVVLDARLRPPAGEVAPLRSRGATVAVLAWGRSASAAAGQLSAAAYPGTLLGFSLVPGVPGARPSVELMAPVGAGARSPEKARRGLVRAAALLEVAGATVEIVPDTAGGVAFRVVALLANEALGALAQGLALRGEMDKAMRLGVNYPLGPLEWAERIGLGELHDALRGLHDETLESRFAPQPFLTQLAAVGATAVPDRERPDES